MSKVRLVEDEEENKSLTQEENLQPIVREVPADRDIDEAVEPHKLRIKRFCLMMLLSLPIIPAFSWYIDPYHFVFYQSLVICAGQIFVAGMGFRASRADYYSRIEYFRKIVHVFYIYFLISLVFNEIAAIFIASSDNFEHCGEMVNNRVCVNRTGLMTGELNVLLFSPGLDFSVWIFYRYLLTVLNDCQKDIIRVRV
jgi:hypothetical protein